MDKKVLKHDLTRGDNDVVALQFEVQYYPCDVTQVLQYSTLISVISGVPWDEIRGGYEGGTVTLIPRY